MFDVFFMVFLSMFLEGLPFLIIGSLFSSFILVYVSEERLLKSIPHNRFLGVLSACFIGFVFPVCECAIVPVFSRLVKKGLPLYIAVTILVSAPLINPIVLLSTYYAFTQTLGYVYLRFIMGFLVAYSIGLLVPSSLKRGDVLLPKAHAAKAYNCCCESRFTDFLNHAVNEFFGITRFFILGSMSASFFQVVFPRHLLMGLVGSWFLSISFMMVFTYLTSVCSEVDAFIARSFMGQFTPGAIISFLTFGPMIDLRNTFLHLNYFRRKYVLALVFLIAASNFLVGFSVNCLLWIGGVYL
ncbi:MAG: permease [Candidatus Altiarchaeota archaeon]|nr:permease [Candidatus Altiarchaeota archaeon]